MVKDEKFPFYLRRSFYIHCLLASLGLLGGKIVMTQQMKMHNENLELIRASVRVDMVAMPQHTLAELKTMSTDQPATPAPLKEEIREEIKEVVKDETKVIAKEAMKMESRPEEGKHQDFLTKLKHLSSQKIPKKNVQASIHETQQLKQLVLAGNKLSKGTEAYGDSRGGDQTAYQAYVSRLPQRVKPYWQLPTFLAEKKLRCRVRVWIAMDGQLSRAEIYQSSGDSEYDQKALEAVNSASPFPELSEEFGKRVVSGGIVLGFPL